MRGTLRTYHLCGIYLCALIAVSTCTESLYKINSPKKYVAFSGDLEITYRIPNNVSIPNAFIVLSALQTKHHKEREITTLSMKVGENSGKRAVSCGIIESGGFFQFRMYMYRGGPILAVTTVDVQWPVFSLTIPREHVAFTGDIRLIVNSSCACNSKLHRYFMYVDLLFQGERARKSAYGSQNEAVQQIRVSDLALSNANFSFSCSVTDLAGFYQAVLRSTYNRRDVLSRSGIMKVAWSSGYSLSLPFNHSFPCGGNVSVLYTQPKCSWDSDRIRTFSMVRKASGSVAAPLVWNYLAEKYTSKRDNFVVFDCSLFNVDVTGFCFVYETTARNGAVREQTRYCISAKQNAVLTIDGGWSQWSQWAMCTTSCGLGKRSRFRLCNNPPTTQGGRFCVGELIQWEDCHIMCNEIVPLMPFKSPNQSHTCACGCTLRKNSGPITATGQCSGFTVWLIKVSANLRIAFIFKFTSLLQDSQWVKVRDGDSSDDRLLAFSAVNRMPKIVTSTANKMRVEFMSNLQLSSSPSLHLHGFLAEYTTFANNVTSTPLIPSPLLKEKKQPEWENAVTVVGIVVCVLILSASVAFVVYHKVYRRPKHKYMVAAQESPMHMAKSTSMPSSPGTGPDDMEAPLTKPSSQKEKEPSLKSPGPSITSTSSKGPKKFKTKADVLVSASPKLSPQNYTPLPSPYTANATPEDYVHGVNILRASPVSRLGTPRSPKVHPLRSKSVTPQAVTPSPKVKPCRRQRMSEEESNLTDLDERFIPGASGTASSQNHGTSSSGKTPENQEGVAPPAAGSASDTSSRKERGRRRDKSKFFKLPTPKDFHSQPDGIPLMTLQDKSDYDLKEAQLDYSSASVKDTNRSPSSRLQQTTAFVQYSNSKPKRPTSLLDDENLVTFNKAFVSLPRPTPKEEAKDIRKYMDAKHRSALRPDGQSPELLRNEKTPRSLTPRSIKSLKTLSPSKSITTPSSITSEGLELEYDDFIMDDPFSYFDKEDTLKLRWQGGEKIGKPFKDTDSASLDLQDGT